MSTDKISLMVSENVGSFLSDVDARSIFLDKIQALGIGGIELMLAEKESHYRDTEALVAFSEELSRREMCVPCADICVDFLLPDRFDEVCRTIDKMLDAAAALKAPLAMICGSVLPEWMEPDQGREIIARGIDCAIRSGRARGVSIAIESFGISYELQSTTTMLEDIFGRLEESPCFFVGDLGNPCYGGELPIVSLQAFFDKLRHVHVKDVKKTGSGMGFPSSEGYWLDSASLGSGIADVQGSLRFLEHEKYCGWYSLELALGDDLDIVGEHASRLRKLLADYSAAE